MESQGDIFGLQEAKQIDVSIFSNHVIEKFRKFLKTHIVAPGVDLFLPKFLSSIIENLFTPAMSEEWNMKAVYITDELISPNTKIGGGIQQNVVFFIPPDIEQIKRMCFLIHKIKQEDQTRNFHCVVIPRRNIFVKEKLEKAGLSSVIIHDFYLDLIPLDKDLLSLELQDSYHLLNLKMDYTPLRLIAESLHRLQVVYGKISNIFSVGQNAAIVTNILASLENESKIKYEIDEPEIDALILIDRKTDLITPLCTQFTYHGLLDDFLTIKNDTIRIKESWLLKSENSKKGPNDYIDLSLKNEVFKEIKNCHCIAAQNAAKKKYQDAQEILRSKNDTRDLQATNEYLMQAANVKKNHEHVVAHLSISHYLLEEVNKPSFKRGQRMEQSCLAGGDMKEMLSYIESLIIRNQDLAKVLKMYCLQCLVKGGFTIEQLDYYRREMAYSYGLEAVLTLNNLEKAGFIKVKDPKAKSQFEILSDPLKLIFPDITEQNPNDASFSYSGYCPLTVRLVEAMLKKPGWNGFSKDVINAIPGLVNCEKFNPDQKSLNREKQTIFVFFIGGVTLSEVSALRYVAKKNKVEIIVATTDVVTHQRILQPFIVNAKQITEIGETPGGSSSPQKK